MTVLVGSPPVCESITRTRFIPWTIVKARFISQPFGPTFGGRLKNCRSLGCPGFPVEVGDVAIFMRFSLQKTAHAAFSSAANRKFGYARDDKGDGDVSMESGCWTEGVFNSFVS